MPPLGGPPQIPQPPAPIPQPPIDITVLPPPPPAPIPQPPIDITVLSPTQTSAPGANHTTAGVTLPKEIWDKITSDMIGVTHCRSPSGFGGFLCENSETYDHIASALSSLVTALAVIFGGYWAYRKFLLGRTFQPRSRVEVSTQWHELRGVTAGYVLQVRISVTNIGASKLTLIPPPASVMRIRFPSQKQTTTVTQRENDPLWPDIRWAAVPELEGQPKTRGWNLLKHHRFIEPGETVFDDKLLNLFREPTLVQVQVQLCWQVPRFLRKNTVVYDFVDQIFPPDAVIYENRPRAGAQSVAATKQEAG